MSKPTRQGKGVRVHVGNSAAENGARLTRAPFACAL